MNDNLITAGIGAVIGHAIGGVGVLIVAIFIFTSGWFYFDSRNCAQMAGGFDNKYGERWCKVTKVERFVFRDGFALPGAMTIAAENMVNALITKAPDVPKFWYHEWYSKMSDNYVLKRTGGSVNTVVEQQVVQAVEKATTESVQQKCDNFAQLAIIEFRVKQVLHDTVQQAQARVAETIATAVKKGEMTTDEADAIIGAENIILPYIYSLPETATEEDVRDYFDSRCAGSQK